jgi:hypothetical protein
MNQNSKKHLTRMILALQLAVLLITLVPQAEAGQVGGAGSGWSIVGPYDANQYEIRLRGNETTWISVSGDGSTDLDLFVYDQWGNLIASDEDETDDCIVGFSPNATGYFRIVVRNFGDEANAYSINTN